MNGTRFLRWALVLGALLIAVFVAHKVRWEEVDVVDEAHGKAATDPYYSLRHVLQGAGATFEARTSLEPLPPAGATLLLASDLWNIFPERDARLRAWVEAGGHLVLVSPHAHGSDEGLRWVPLSSVDTRRHAARNAPAPSDAEDDEAQDDDHDDAPSERKPQQAEEPKQRKLTPQQAEQQRRRAERMERTTEVVFYGAPAPALSAVAEAAAGKLLAAVQTLLPAGQDHLCGEWCIADVDLALMLNRLVLNGDAVPQRLADYARRQWRHPAVQRWVAFERPAL